MSSDALNTNPIGSIDQDIWDRFLAGDLPILGACHMQMTRCSQEGRDVPDAVDYAWQAHTSRRTHRIIDERSEESFKREVPRDYEQRVFIPLYELDLLGKRFKQTIVKLAKGLSTNASEYFSWVLANDVIPSQVKSSLIKTRLGNRGPGLGPTNERRAALALAILKDRELIQGFQLCGEAGKPIILDKADKEERFFAGAHEEAMAVDIIVKIASFPYASYVPLQIKSNGNCTYDQTKRYLTVDENEKKEIERLAPQTKGLFVRSYDNPARFRLKIQRRVIKLGLNDRKIVKNHRKDFDDDITNKLLAIIEYSVEQGETMTLSRPYQKLTYPEKVAAMMSSGFIKPVADENRELDAIINSYADQRKST